MIDNIKIKISIKKPNKFFAYLNKLNKEFKFSLIVIIIAQIILIQIN